MTDSDKDLFDNLKNKLLNIDPAYFCQKYLTLDGKPFRLIGNGYKPLTEIYRYIGVKALEPTAKPVIIVKGRQVGMTTMASAMEMYFMGSGIFGVGEKPPIRIIHAFPQLELAAAYSKTKLNQIISSSVPLPSDPNNKTLKPKAYMQSLLDQSTATNDSLHFKQFVGGNHLWIESVGLDGDRVMGRTADVIFFDECFPYNQKIATNLGKMSIGLLYKKFVNKDKLPFILTFNEDTKKFEYKKIANAFKREKRKLLDISLCGRKISCTPNHKFLTEFGWKPISEINEGTLIKSYSDSTKHINALNEDQKQIILGSFLGDGHVRSEGTSRFRLSVIHGMKQFNYCKWKSDIFNCNYKIIDNNGYSKKNAVVFTTKLFGMNRDFPKNKSDCPQWVLDELDARGIAIWFMDDGSITNRWNNGDSATLSTCSFNEESQKRFVKKFSELGINCHYQKYDNQFYLYFGKESFKKLSELIAPYLHQDMEYKISAEISEKQNIYDWNNKYLPYQYLILDKKQDSLKEKIVYDIEVEDNHNFILSPNKFSKYMGGPIVHNCQKTTGIAIGNSLKTLTTAKYGKPSKGVQVYFGTPRRKGSDFHKMWQTSSQQYYYLGCEKCKEYFPLYTPGTDEWKSIWIYGFIVKCTHCGHEQNKLDAAERGKWVALKDPEDADCKMIGFHINQLYMPMFTREDIENELPGKHPINTERVFMNEVIGEFFQGDSSPITPEEIKEKCGDDRKFSSRIDARSGPDQQIVVLGIDYGARADAEQLADVENAKSRGQSYSTAVILSAKGPGLLHLEFATKFKRNDPESKKGLIEQLMRQYSVNLAIGDIGYSNDFSQTLHQIYGDKYLVSRAHPKVNHHIKYTTDSFPKELVFERDYYIGELYDQLKRGMIKFPYGDYEKIAWLIDHCCSMEIKPSISRMGGDPQLHYVKGGTPNDGFMALLNAYLAFKFILTKGFTNLNPLLQQTDFNTGNKPLVTTGYIRRKF